MYVCMYVCTYMLKPTIPELGRAWNRRHHLQVTLLASEFLGGCSGFRIQGFGVMVVGFKGLRGLGFRISGFRGFGFRVKVGGFRVGFI